MVWSAWQLRCRPRASCQRWEAARERTCFTRKGKNLNLRCGHEITIIVKGFAAAFCTVHCFFFSFFYEYVPMRESGLNSLHHDPEWDTEIGVGHLVSETVRTITVSCSFRSMFLICRTAQGSQIDRIVCCSLNFIRVKLCCLEREIVCVLTDMLTHTAMAEARHPLYWRLWLFIMSAWMWNITVRRRQEGCVSYTESI